MKFVMLTGAALTAALTFCGQALAADEPTTVAEIYVQGRDKVGLLETRANATIFGLAKPLIETPRAATSVSDQTIERYGIEEVDDLTVITPGAATASFYGVKGAVNLRGTLAEAYFRGFKRIENRGTYSTPLGAASQIDILRGPPAAFSGPGKVGGYLNIEPKTARTDRGYLTGPSGQAQVTVGSYGKFNVAGQAGAPYSLGDGVEGGVFGYVEYEHSDSFYRGIHPRDFLLQLSSETSLPDDYTLSAGYMRFNSSGNVQTPGWNRVTQQLVDSQLYITGRDTTLVDSDANGRLTPNESGSLVQGYFNFPPTPPAAFTLDTGVGLAKISPRTVFVSDADFNDTTTNTGYLDLSKALSATSNLKLQTFYDDLTNKRFVSYGFPAAYDSWALEARASYDFVFEAGDFRAANIVGASYRYQKAHKRESFNGGYLGLDRRDLIYGPTATDIFDSPFSTEPAGVTGVGWDYDNHSRYGDAGLFLVSDMSYGPVGLLLGGRYDEYDIRATDTGALTYAFPPSASVRDGDGTFSASLTYKAPFGLIPYFTYAESSAIEVGQAGDVAPSLIASGQWLSDSVLKEGGVKFTLLDGRFVGAVSIYEQSRTQLSITNTVSRTEGRGVEVEARWLATDNISFTLAANDQKTIIKGPDHTVFYLPTLSTGLSGAQQYGGSYLTFDFSTCSCGYPGDYENKTIPGTVVSLYSSYVTDREDWGQAGVTAGIQHVSSTSGLVRGAVQYPDYSLVTLSGFLTFGDYQVVANIDNLFNRLYFQPLADVYSSLGVLPGKGREFRLTLKRNF